MQAVPAVWVPETAHVDDTKVRALLTEHGPGLIKDKCAMPFVQLFKGAQSQAKPSSWTSSPCVCVFLILTRAHMNRIVEFGAETAFKRELWFGETDVLRKVLLAR